ncbi:MAG: TRAP transporter large permease [Candidatus Hodarchaeota archaeon]
MSTEVVGSIGIGVLIVLMLARIPIGFAMALVGLFGLTYLESIKYALAVFGTVPYHEVAQYAISVVPLFVLMGTVVSNAGLSRDLYDAAHMWLGQLPGGLAIATIGGCAGFASICGSSMATAVTMGKVALPEMRKHGYDTALATGAVASGGTLGILIPPSLGFIIYGILTEQSVGDLFIAGILPGVLLTTLFMIYILVIASRNPQLAPAGQKTSFRDKIASLKLTWPIPTLFLLVMGGIYMGVFTPTEAGGIGAFGAIVITGCTRRLSGQMLGRSAVETAQTTAMIMVIIIGTFIFMHFLTISKLPFALAGFVSGLPLPALGVFGVVVFIYLILGMLLDIMAAMVLTLPIVYPVMVAIGFDPIWLGVVIVILMEAGLITPPVGMNIFVLGGLTDTSLGTIFRGVLPFVVAMLVCIVILTIFPQIPLLLLSLMR